MSMGQAGARYGGAQRRAQSRQEGRAAKKRAANKPANKQKADAPTRRAEVIEMMKPSFCATYSSEQILSTVVSSSLHQLALARNFGPFGISIWPTPVIDSLGEAVFAHQVFLPLYKDSSRSGGECGNPFRISQGRWEGGKPGLVFQLSMARHFHGFPLLARLWLLFLCFWRSGGSAKIPCLSSDWARSVIRSVALCTVARRNDPASTQKRQVRS